MDACSSSSRNGLLTHMHSLPPQVVYDVTDQDSFNNVKQWLSEIDRWVPWPERSRRGGQAFCSCRGPCSGPPALAARTSSGLQKRQLGCVLCPCAVHAASSVLMPCPHPLPHPQVCKRECEQAAGGQQERPHQQAGGGLRNGKGGAARHSLVQCLAARRLRLACDWHETLRTPFLLRVSSMTHRPRSTTSTLLLRRLLMRSASPSWRRPPKTPQTWSRPSW